MTSKIFSIIGVVAVVVATFYFCIYTPYSSYAELKIDYNKLQKSYDAKCDEVDKVYENFYNAIRAHTDWETTKAIYNDSKYFESDAELRNKKFNPNISEFSHY